MKNQISTILKRFFVFTFTSVAVLTLASCDSKQENQTENALENKADALENQADNVRKAGEDNSEGAKKASEGTADALENKADAVRDAKP